VVASRTGPRTLDRKFVGGDRRAGIYDFIAGRPGPWGWITAAAIHHYAKKIVLYGTEQSLSLIYNKQITATSLHSEGGGRLLTKQGNFDTVEEFSSSIQISATDLQNEVSTAAAVVMTMEDVTYNKSAGSRSILVGDGISDPKTFQLAVRRHRDRAGGDMAYRTSRLRISGFVMISATRVQPKASGLGTFTRLHGCHLSAGPYWETGCGGAARGWKHGADQVTLDPVSRRLSEEVRVSRRSIGFTGSPAPT